MNHYEALLSSASRVSATGLHASHESILRGLGVCSGDDLLVAMSPLRFFKSVSIDNNLVEDLSTEIYLEQQCRSLPTFAHYDDYQWLRRLSDSKAEKIHLAFQTFCTQSIDSISLEALTREIDAYPALFVSKQARRRPGPECYRFPPPTSGLVADPSPTGHNTVRFIADGRNDTSLRFPSDNSICTITFSISEPKFRPTLLATPFQSTTNISTPSEMSTVAASGAESQSGNITVSSELAVASFNTKLADTPLAFVHISWDIGCAPSHVFLQLSNNGQNWITSDFVNLDSRLPSELYDIKSKFSLDNETDDNQLKNGTLLHTSKLVRSLNGNGYIWKEQQVCVNATHARLIFHNFHKSSNEKRIIGVKNILLIKENIQQMKADGGNLPSDASIKSYNSFGKYCDHLFNSFSIDKSTREAPSQSSTSSTFLTTTFEKQKLSSLSFTHVLSITIERLFDHCMKVLSEPQSDSFEKDRIDVLSIVRLLSSICLLSGNASALMAVVSILLQANKCGLKTTRSKFLGRLVSYASKLTSAVSSCHSLRRKREAAREIFEKNPLHSEILFDPVHKSSNMVISNGGATISSVRTRKDSYASTNIGFPLIGRHSWTFRVDQDIKDDETTCVGFCVKPVRDGDYERSLDMWLIRCYSGETFNSRTGFVKKRIPHGPIHPGSLITFILLKTTVFLEVDGVSQGAVFEIPNEIVLQNAANEGQRSEDTSIIFPCVQMYSGDRSCTILNCTSSNVSLEEYSTDKGVPLSAPFLLCRSDVKTEAALKTFFATSAQLPIGSLGVDSSPPGPIMGVGSDTPSTAISVQGKPSQNAISLLPDIRAVSALCQSTVSDFIKSMRGNSSQPVSRSAVVAVAHFKTGSAFCNFSFRLRVQEDTIVSGVDSKSIFLKEFLSVRIYGDVKSRNIEYRRLLFSTEPLLEHSPIFGHTEKTIYANYNSQDNMLINLDVEDVEILTVIVIAKVSASFLGRDIEPSICLGDLDSIATFAGETICASSLPVIVLDEAFLGPSPSALLPKISSLLEVNSTFNDIEIDAVKTASQLFSTLTIPYYKISSSSCEIDSTALTRFYAEELVPFPKLVEITSKVVHLPLHSPRYVPQTPRIAQPVRQTIRGSGTAPLPPPLPGSRSSAPSLSTLDPGLAAFANAMSRNNAQLGSESTSTSTTGDNVSPRPSAVGLATGEGQLRGWSETDLEAAIAASLVSDPILTSSSTTSSMPSIETIIALTGYDGNIEDIDEELAEALYLSLPPEALLSIPTITSHNSNVLEPTTEPEIYETKPTLLAPIELTLFGASFNSYLPESIDDDSARWVIGSKPPFYLRPKYQSWEPVELLDTFDGQKRCTESSDGTLSFEVTSMGLSSTVAVIGSIGPSSVCTDSEDSLKLFNNALFILRLQLYHLDSRRIAPPIVFSQSFFTFILSLSNNKYLAQCLHQWLRTTSSDVFFASTKKKIQAVIDLIKSEPGQLPFVRSLWISIVDDIRRGRFKILSNPSSKVSPTWSILKTLLSTVIDSLNQNVDEIDFNLKILEELNIIILSRVSAALGMGSLCGKFQASELSSHFAQESSTSMVSSRSVVATMTSIEYSHAISFAEYIELLCDAVCKVRSKRIVNIMESCLSVCCRIAGNLSAAVHTAPSMVRIIERFFSLLPRIENDASFSSSTIVNALSYSRKGDRDNYSGQVGVRLCISEKCTDGLVVYALGRSVCSKDSNRLQRDHIVSLWNEDDERLLASVIVNDECVRDCEGFAIAELERPIRLYAGARLRLTSTEYAGCGDAWYEGVKEKSVSSINTAHQAEGCRDTFIELVGDCFKDSLSWIEHCQSNGASQRPTGASLNGSGLNNTGSYFVFGESLFFPDQGSTQLRGPGMASLFYYLPEESPQQSDGFKRLRDLCSHAVDTAARSVSSLIAAMPESEEEESTRVWLSFPCLTVPSSYSPCERILSKIYLKDIGCLGNPMLSIDKLLCYSGSHSQMLVPTGSFDDPNSQISWKNLVITESGEELLHIEDLREKEAIHKRQESHDSFADLCAGLIIVLSEGFDEIDSPAFCISDKELELIKDASSGIFSAISFWRNYTIPGQLLPPRGRTTRNEPGPPIPTSLIGAAAVVEAWLQMHSPEDRRKLYRSSADPTGASITETAGNSRLDYSKPRPRFSRVCGPFLAAILRHTDLISEVVSALQYIHTTYSSGEKLREKFVPPQMSLPLNRVWLKVKHVRNWIRDEIEAFEIEAKEAALQNMLTSDSLDDVNTDSLIVNSQNMELPHTHVHVPTSSSSARPFNNSYEEEEDDEISMQDLGVDDDDNDNDDNEQEDDDNDEDEGEEEDDDEDGMNEEVDDGEEDEEDNEDDEDNVEENQVPERIISLTQRLMSGLGGASLEARLMSGLGGAALEALASLVTRTLPDSGEQTSPSQLRNAQKGSLIKSSSQIHAASAQVALAISRRKRVLRANRAKRLRVRRSDVFLGRLRTKCLYLITTEVQKPLLASNDLHLRGFVTPLLDECYPVRAAADEDLFDPLDHRETILHVFVTYVKNSSAPPELLLSCVLRQLVRAKQRALGLSLQRRLTRLTKENGSRIDLARSIAYLRESLTGRSKSRAEKSCALSIALSEMNSNTHASKHVTKPSEQFEVIPGGIPPRLKTLLMQQVSHQSKDVVSIGNKLWMLAANEGELLNGFPTPGCEFSVALCRAEHALLGLMGSQSLDEIGGVELRSYIVGCSSTGTSEIANLRDLYVSIVNDVLLSLHSSVMSCLDVCTDRKTRDAVVSTLGTSMSLLCTDLQPNDVDSILTQSVIESILSIRKECDSKSIERRIESVLPSFEDILVLFKEFSPSRAAQDLVEGQISKGEVIALLRIICRALVPVLRDHSSISISGLDPPITLDGLLNAEDLNEEKVKSHSASSLGRVYKRLYCATLKISSILPANSTQSLKELDFISLIRSARAIRASTEAAFEYMILNSHILGSFRRVRFSFGYIQDAAGSRLESEDDVESTGLDTSVIIIAGNSRSAIATLERNRDNIRRAHESLRRAIAVSESQYILSCVSNNTLFLSLASSLIRDFVEACKFVNMNNERVYTERQIFEFLIWLTRVASAPNSVNSSGPLALFFKNEEVWIALLCTCVSRVSPRVSQQTFRLLSLVLPRTRSDESILISSIAAITSKDARFLQPNAALSLMHHFLFILSHWLNLKSDLDVLSRTDSDGQVSSSIWPFMTEGTGSASAHLACAAEIISTLRCLSFGQSRFGIEQRADDKDTWKSALEKLLPQFISSAALSACNMLDVSFFPSQSIHIRSYLTRIEPATAIDNMRMGLACLAVVGSSSGCETLRVGARVLVRSSPLMTSDLDGIAWAPIGAADPKALGLATVVNYEIGSNTAQVIFEGSTGAPLSAVSSSILTSEASAGKSISDLISSAFDKAANFSLVSAACTGAYGPNANSNGPNVQQMTPSGCSKLSIYTGIGEAEDFDSSLLVPLDSFLPPNDLISLSSLESHLTHLPFLSSIQLLLSLESDTALGSATQTIDLSSTEQTRSGNRRQRFFSGDFTRNDEFESIVPEIDEIARLRIALRTSSLSALDALVSNPAVCAELVSLPGLLKKIMDIALVPSSLPTFVCTARLRQRELALKCMLTESSFGWSFSETYSKVSFSEFQTNLESLMQSMKQLSMNSHSENEFSAKDAHEMTEAIMTESQAQILVQMGLGFDLEACKFALKSKGGNLDIAANWLMSGEGSAKVRSEMERRRVADLAIAASHESSSGPGAGGIGVQTGLLRSALLSGQQITKTAARWREAAELASILGHSFSETLCFQALLLRNENKDSAMEWLLDSGATYSNLSIESPLQKVTTTYEQSQSIGKRTHEAALEDASDTMSLLPNILPAVSRAPSTGSSTSTAAASAVAALAAALMPQSFPNTDTIETDLRLDADVSPPLIPFQRDLSGIKNFSKVEIAQHIAATGASEVTLSAIDYIQRRNSDLVVISTFNTTHEGDVLTSRSSPLSLYLRDRYGILLPQNIAPNLTSRRLLRVFNAETGASTVKSVNPEHLRGIYRILGRNASSSGQIRSLLVANSIALGALISRRIVAAIIHLWPIPQPLLGIGATPLSLESVGGGSRFVSLVKLIAASSQAFSSSSGTTSIDSTSGNTGDDGHSNSVISDDSSYPVVSMLHINPVRTITNLISSKEQTSIETAEVTIMSGQSGQSQSTPLSLVDAVRNGLTRLLVNEVQSKLGSAGFRKNVESFDVFSASKASSLAKIEASPLLRPMNTPLIRSMTSSLSLPEDLDLGAPQISTPLPAPLSIEVPSLSEISLSLPNSTTNDSEGRISADKNSENSGKESKLARILVEQCVRNFIVSTSADEPDSLTSQENVEATAESLHPIFPVCDYVGELICSGAKAMRVSFDFRCELDQAHASLSFFSDRALSQRLATYPVSTSSSPGQQLSGTSAFPPLLVHSDKVFFSFKSTRQSSDGLGSWGYKLVASPMRGLQWLNDPQVVAEPSLEWACWLLDFFLHDVGRLSRELFVAVHHKSIFDALVRYLRTPGAPFKSRIVVLLTQLLAHPDAFPESYTPDLSRDLLPISDLCLKRAQTLLSATPGTVSFLPPQMLQRVELASATHIAARFFDSRAKFISKSGGVSMESEELSPQSQDKQEVLELPLMSSGVGLDKHSQMERALSIGVAGFAPVALKTAIRITKLEADDHVERVVFPVISKTIPKVSDSDLKNIFLDLADLASALSTTPNAPLSARASGGAASASVDVVPNPNIFLTVAENERLSAIASFKMSENISGQDFFSTPEIVPGTNAIRLKDSHLCKAWEESCGSIAVVETSHPYRAGERLVGELSFPNTKSLRITLDRRTTLALGCSLRFWVSDRHDVFPGKPILFCGAVHEKSKINTSSSGEVNDAIDLEVSLGSGATLADTVFSMDTCASQQQATVAATNLEREFAKACSKSAELRQQSDMKDWTSEGKDVAVVDGCFLRFAFVAPNEDCTVDSILDADFEHPAHSRDGNANSLGLWGVAFSVSSNKSETEIENNSNLLSTSTFKGPLWLPILSLNAAAIAMAQFPRELDELIISWVNSHSVKGVGGGGDDDPSSAPGSKGSRRLVRSGLEMCADQFRLSRKESKFGFEPLSRVSLSILQCRFSLLRMFNRKLSKVLELVDATSASDQPLGRRGVNGSGSVVVRRCLSNGFLSNEEIEFDPVSLSAGGSMLSQQLRNVSHLVFSELKNKLLDAAVTMTWVPRRPSHQSRVEIHLDNMRALLSSEAGQVDLISGQSIFLQAFRQLSRLSASNRANLFRSQLDERGCLFRVRYVNEQGIDYGGVFRDACTKMTEDLFSDRLDLFLPTPNAVQAAQGRQIEEEAFGTAGGDSTYLPNPKYCSLPPSTGEGGASSTSMTNASGSSAMSSSRLAPQLFVFVGQLMAISLRTKLALPFELPSLVWKLLVGQSLTLGDLQSIDATTVNSIMSVAFWNYDEGDLYAPSFSQTRLQSFNLSSSPMNANVRSSNLSTTSPRGPTETIQHPTMSPSSSNVKGGLNSLQSLCEPEYSQAARSAFARAFPLLRFSTKSLDGCVIDLVVQGGRNVRVSLASRWQYVQSALSYHMTAYDCAIKHIQRGLYSLVPARALRLLSWHELAFSVAGRPEIDTNQLRKHTVYEGYRATDETIVMFWRVFESISNAERSLFIRFAWGRSRLPVKWGSTRFKLARRPAGDEQLPIAHTCFFSVELPPYSNESRMRTAILAAIYFSGGILSA